MSNNSNFNYLQTIPTESAPSYQPAQQYQQQQFNIQQQPQVMGPNGQMINRPELEQAIMKFQKVNPKYKFEIMSSYLPIKLEQHYKKYFDYFETIKQRRGQEEYLSDLRRLLNKMNDYITKTEQTIIKLKKTLDYTESTLPTQSQFQPTINGAPPVQNTFMIHELQNVIEKDNNIEFVDIFGLKGKNIARIDPADRITILIIVQSLMGFNPSPNPLENDKLMKCLNILKEKISDYSKENVGDDDKLNIDIKDPMFKPLVKIDIYSKLFDIFDKGSINIKDIKTDKISERIESSQNKSPSPSSQSPFGFLRGGGYEPSFGGPRRNNRKENNKNKKPQGNSKTNISGKIKKILKYELGSTDAGNKQFEIEKSVQKKGKDMTEYLFFSEEFSKELQDMRPNTYEISNNKSENNTQTGGINPPHSKKKPQKLKNNEKFLLTGKKIIDYIKETKEENPIKKEFISANFDKFILEIQNKYDKEIKPNIGIKNSGHSLNSLTSLSKQESGQTAKQTRIRELEDKITKLKAETPKPPDYDKKLLDFENEKKQIEIAYKYSVLKKDLEQFINLLNNILKSEIEQYKYRIYKCGEESFNTLDKTVKDFFTGTQDKIKTKNDYRNRKNNDKKDITFIQMYIMMYEAYKEYYDKYSIETVIKSFTTDTIKSDNETKLCILNGLGLYSVLVYNKIKQVRDIIKGILQQSNPNFEKAKTMLIKVQTLINSSPDEEKKEKLLKIKKNIEEQINKLAENKKNNRGQNRKNTSGNTKPWEKDKGENKKPWEKNKFGEKKPWEKDKDKFGEKKYKKSYNNNVSL
jgi:hypothetical protein